MTSTDQSIIKTEARGDKKWSRTSAAAPCAATCSPTADPSTASG
jgi:hypothetical protein